MNITDVMYAIDRFGSDFIGRPDGVTRFATATRAPVQSPATIAPGDRDRGRSRAGAAPVSLRLGRG